VDRPGGRRQPPNTRIALGAAGVALVVAIVAVLAFDRTAATRLRADVERIAVADAAAEWSDSVALARRHHAWIRNLGAGGDVQGSVNRDGTDTLSYRVVALLFEAGGGDSRIEAADAARGPVSARPEVQEALLGAPGSGCVPAPEEDLLICWALARDRHGRLSYVMKSTSLP